MTTRQSTIDFLLDQLSDAGLVSARKMFGEYCLYHAGKPFGLVCDDQLYLKNTPTSRSLIEASGPVVEASPYPGARPHLLISADLWDERSWLCTLVQATARDLPPPKPKVSKVPKAAKDTK